jgi:hypothetical protein
MVHALYPGQDTRRNVEDRLVMNERERRGAGQQAVAGTGTDRGPTCQALAATWRLRACTRTDAAYRVSTLYEHAGARSIAYYVKYRANGTLCLVSARAGRLLVSPLDLIGVGGLLVEPVGAGDLRLAACGTYTLEAGILVHRLDGRHFPAWLGLDREQLVDVSGGTLVWHTPPQGLDGQTRATRLIWERA